jgi:uncharacterized protein (DUF2141 family)
MSPARGIIAFTLLWGTLGFVLAQPGGTPSEQRGTIVVHVTGIRSNYGHVRIGLFNRAEGFPKDSSKAVTGVRVTIQNREAVATFSDLPYGTYAVGAHHDENDNYKVDVNWLRKPTEMYGASNNPRPRLGPPLWKDSKFELNSDTMVVEIRLHN